MVSETEDYIDEFYESIRAPQYFDFNSKHKESTPIDSWFQTKVNDKYDDSSEEDLEHMQFTNSLLDDSDFDSRTPPKPKSRSKTASVSKCGESARKQTDKTGKKAPSKRALQLLERQRAMSRRLKARRAESKPVVAPKIARKTVLQPKEVTAQKHRPTLSNRSSLKISNTSKTSVRQPKEVTQKDSTEEFIFRALPLDRRVLESCGDRGVPKIAKIPVTRPRSPNLSTKKRSMIRKNSRNSSSGDELNRSSQDSDSEGVLPNEFIAFDRETSKSKRSSIQNSGRRQRGNLSSARKPITIGAKATPKTVSSVRQPRTQTRLGRNSSIVKKVNKNQNQPENNENVAPPGKNKASVSSSRPLLRSNR